MQTDSRQNLNKACFHVIIFNAWIDINRFYCLFWHDADTNNECKTIDMVRLNFGFKLTWTSVSNGVITAFLVSLNTWQFNTTFGTNSFVVFPFEILSTADYWNFFSFFSFWFFLCCCTFFCRKQNYFHLVAELFIMIHFTSHSLRNSKMFASNLPNSIVSNKWRKINLPVTEQNRKDTKISYNFNHKK